MKNPNEIAVKTPGKLILSGEHAVVYGQPAIAMAISRYATAAIRNNTLPDVAFHLMDLAHRSRVSLKRLHNLKERIKRQYQRFTKGELEVRRILKKPAELAQFAFSLIDEVRPLVLPDGARIQVKSDIPMGCGMGSSAATILCVIYAVSKHLALALSDDTLFELALIAEKIQHGYSSGVDLRVMIQGGVVYVRDQHVEARVLPEMPFYLVHTGMPLSSTGECVAHAKKYFVEGKLLEDFAFVTNAMDQALCEQSFAKIQENIKLNHRLLTIIEMVPEKVQSFVKAIEAVSGSAKVCGAGSREGDAAGALLVCGEDREAMQAIAKEFGYTFHDITVSSRGVHVA